MKSLLETLLGFWWISWFGFIGGFLYISGLELTREFSEGGPAYPFSLILLIFTVISWALFFLADSKAQKRDAVVLTILTLMGTMLAIFSTLGIWFFAVIAPRVQ